MNKKIWIIVVALLVIAGVCVYIYSKNNDAVEKSPVENTPVSVNQPVIEQSPAPLTELKTNENVMPTVKITTNKGEIVIELFKDDAPKTVENFLNLVQKNFYDGVIFHRVISGFMIQGGDPTGTGSGGPGYKFEDELNASTPSYQRGYLRGTVAMANSGPNSNGSQFFIMHADYPLPNLYTIFGRVVTGLETVDAIAAEKTDSGDRPLSKVVIEKVEVIE